MARGKNDVVDVLDGEAEARPLKSAYFRCNILCHREQHDGITEEEADA